ncbi:MAG TPA: hypothetical protein DIW77_15665 [Chromatiaceae bacterium]|nr:MAG: hypothetical protein N838_11950 [Thiohalocapsa sp. PB-PSB1]HCS91432.1 hypothetical protein [Chromatiaceae bacterium]
MHSWEQEISRRDAKAQRKKNKRKKTERRRMKYKQQRLRRGHCAGYVNDFSFFLPFAPLRLCATLFLPRRNSAENGDTGKRGQTTFSTFYRIAAMLKKAVCPRFLRITCIG